MGKFFYKGNDFQPPYLYMALFMVLIIATFIEVSLKILTESFAIAALGSFTAAFSAIMALYNWDTKNKISQQNQSTSTN